MALKIFCFDISVMVFACFGTVDCSMPFEFPKNRRHVESMHLQTRWCTDPEHAKIVLVGLQNKLYIDAIILPPCKQVSCMSCWLDQSWSGTLERQQWHLEQRNIEWVAIYVKWVSIRTYINSFRHIYLRRVATRVSQILNTRRICYETVRSAVNRRRYPSRGQQRIFSQTNTSEPVIADSISQRL